MKAKVDQDMCIGCGMCIGTAPEVFQLNDDGKAEAYADYDETEAALVDAAVDGCPVSAIQGDVEQENSIVIKYLRRVCNRIMVKVQDIGH